MEWNEQYQELIDNPPKAGTILETADGSPARLDRDLIVGSTPFVYGRAYVPEIVGCALGWFLQSVNSKNTQGYKCILLPKARQECLRKFGLLKSILPVKSLCVVRRSKSGMSLLCDIAEYIEETV